jgi:hypothetical protein
MQVEIMKMLQNFYDNLDNNCMQDMGFVKGELAHWTKPLDPQIQTTIPPGYSHNAHNFRSPGSITGWLFRRPGSGVPGWLRTQQSPPSWQQNIAG